MSQALRVVLTDEDHSYIDNLIRRGHSSAHVLNRARILLLADRGRGEKRTRRQITDAALCCALTAGQV